MSAPTPYTLSYDFSSFQASNPTTPIPADRLEIELNNITLTTDQIISNLGLLQRSDGALEEGIVTYSSLDVSVTGILSSNFVPKGDWLTSTSYIVGDLVSEGTEAYVCAVAHSSGTFATDEAAGKWNLTASTTGINSNLVDIGALTPADKNMMIGDGANWVAESGSTLLTSIGLGTGNSPQLTGVNIGNATDTLLARVSAGIASVGGSVILMASNLGVSVQAYSVKLKSIADLTLVGDRMIYATSSTAFAVATLTSSARTFLALADKAAQRTHLDVYNKSDSDGKKTLQSVRTDNKTMSTGTGTIPIDDTIPQISEGDLFITAPSITCANVLNKVRVTVILNIASSGVPNVVLALFQDSVTDAVAAVEEGINDNGRMEVITLSYEAPVGTLLATTFTARVGSSSGTHTINGKSGSRNFGGVVSSSITVEEIKV